MSSSGVPSMQSTPRTVMARALDGEDLDAGERDGVRPHGRAQSEGPARVAEVARHLADEVATGLVHPVEQPGVAVEAEIGEAGGVTRVDLDPAFRLGLGGALGALGCAS